MPDIAVREEMIQFDDRGFTIIAPLDKPEAIAFIAFLKSERARHLEDIVFIDERILETEEHIKELER